MTDNKTFPKTIDWQLIRVLLTDAQKRDLDDAESRVEEVNQHIAWLIYHALANGAATYGLETQYTIDSLTVVGNAIAHSVQSEQRWAEFEKLAAIDQSVEALVRHFASDSVWLWQKTKDIGATFFE